MSNLILTRGIQGSGKTFWSKKWVEEYPAYRIRISWDDIRNMLGKYWVPERENIVKAISEEALRIACKENKDVVIDNMNLSEKSTKRFIEIAEEYKYNIIYKDFFDISVKECIRRDSLRPNPIGEKVIKNTWNRYKEFIISNVNMKKSINWDIPAYVNSRPKAIIVDIDGTVALNVTGRPFYGEGSSEKMESDAPIKQVIDIINNYKGKVIFVTGRNDDEKTVEVTTKWIKNNFRDGLDYEIIFRSNGSYIPAVDFKNEIYINYIRNNYVVEYVLEDSDPVVQMYRDLGLLVLQPNSGI